MLARCRTLLLAAAVAALAGCTSDGPTARQGATVPLVLRAQIVAQQLAGRQIEIAVSYRRTSGVAVPLEVTPSTIAVETTTRQVPVSVSIDPCLRDVTRAPTGQAGCALDVLLRLRGDGGLVEDSVRVPLGGPIQAGASIEAPSVQLFAPIAVAVRAGTRGDGDGIVSSAGDAISCTVRGTALTGRCVASFSGRTPVQLTAAPLPGSDFGEWGVPAQCPGPTNAPCTITITTNTTLTPSFVAQRFPLTVAIGGGGTGAVNVVTGEAASSFVCNTGASTQSCRRDVRLATIAQLTAQPASGSRFVGWSGDCSGTSPNCSVVMSALRDVRAAFSIDSAALAVTVTGSGGTVRSQPLGIDCTVGGLNCTARYPVGTVVSLTATPTSSAFRFAGWSGACSGTGACSVTLTNAQSVGATFVAVTVPLTVTVTGNAGSVSSAPAGIQCATSGAGCTSEFQIGSTVELLATPLAGQGRFVRWTGACAGNTTPTCRVVMSGALTVGAEFERVANALIENVGNGSGRVVDRTTGTTCTLAAGATCTVTVPVGGALAFTATPDTLNRFNGWGDLGASCGTALTCALTLNANGRVTVTFQRILPTLVLTPRALAFVDTIGRPIGATRSVSITSLNGVVPSVTVLRVENTPNVAFLSVGALSGPTPQTLQIAPAVGTFAVGSYTARIIISAPGAANTLDTISVTRTVVPAPLASWLRAVSGRSATDQIAVGSRTSGLLRAVRFNGASWTTIDNPAAQVPRANGIVAVPVGSYIAATVLQMRRYTTGTTWIREGDPPNFQDEYFGIHATVPTGVMAVGSGSGATSNRFDGTQWRQFPIPTLEGTMNAVWSFSQTSAIAVGDFGEWSRFAFGIWTVQQLPSSLGPSMFGIWAASPNFVIAVGEGGTIFRYDGSTWTEMTSSVQGNLRAVFGTSPTNIIAVGDGGLILRYDGTVWRRMTSPVTTALYGVWMADDNDAVAVGANGVILRYSVP
jgi:hypothetical protein